MSEGGPAGVLGQTVIFDLGTGFCKVGFSGDQGPRQVFPSVVGRKRQGGIEYVGEEAISKQAMLRLDYPIHEGILHNSEQLETILIHTYARYLTVDPKDHPLFLTEAPLNPNKNREQLAQLVFENLEVPSLYVGLQGHSTLYASGRVSGLVLESGEGVSQVVPVFEGYPLKHAMGRTEVAGRAVSDYLRLLMTERGHRLDTSPSHLHLARTIKEKLTFISTDFEAQLGDTKGLDKCFELPDGQVLELESERFRAPEVLFQPSLGGLSQPGLQHLIHESICKLEPDVAREVCGCVVVGGGTSRLDGFTRRLKKEFTKNWRDRGPRIVAFKEPELSAWKGSSVLASLSSFQPMFVSKKEFEEHGTNILHTKCF